LRALLVGYFFGLQQLQPELCASVACPAQSPQHFLQSGEQPFLLQQLQAFFNVFLQVGQQLLQSVFSMALLPNRGFLKRLCLV